MLQARSLNSSGVSDSNTQILSFSTNKDISVACQGTWNLKTGWRVIFFFFPALGFELRVYTLSYSTSPIFFMGFFEIGSLKLFSRAGFEP
jgi:hypothetical protein